MTRFLSILAILLCVTVQEAVGASNAENSESLIRALRESSFHRLKFEVPANDLRFTTIEGAKIDLRQLEGKIIFLSFWTVDSPRWPKEMRSLEKLQSRYGNRRIQIVALNLVDPIEKIKAFLGANPTKLLVAFDPDHSLKVNAKKFVRGESSLFVTDRNSVAIYEIPKYPTTYIIDKDGKTLGFFVGPTDWNMAERDDILATLSESREIELSKNRGQFQTDAKQGIAAPPQAPVVGGPTKRGPTQAPLGPQAPIPVPNEETPKTDINALPFKPARETPGPVSKPKETTETSKPSVTQSGTSTKSEADSSITKQKKAKRAHQPTKAPARALRTNKAITPRRPSTTDPFAESRAKPAPPLHGAKASSFQKPVNVKENSSNTPGQLPAAKPYLPPGSSPAQMQPDSSGRVLATVPGATNGTPQQYSRYPAQSPSDLPEAQPLPNRNLIGGSILDSFGNPQQVGAKINQTTPVQTPVQNQPNNVIQQFGQDIMSLGEGIRGTFSRIIGSR